jgi:hypothetical protein
MQFEVSNLTIIIIIIKMTLVYCLHLNLVKIYSLCIEINYLKVACDLVYRAACFFLVSMLTSIPFE